MIIYGFDPNPFSSKRGPGRPEINDFTLDECNGILRGRILCVITSVRALSIAAITSGKGVIKSIVSHLKILSLVRDAVQQYLVFNLWGASQFYAADSSCTLKSPLPLQLQGMLRAGHLSVREARHKPHAGCQDGSKHSARGHWQKEIFCKQQNYFCCLWIVSSNLSVPLLLGVPWEIALIFHQFHHWPVHWLFLPRTTQCYERSPQPTSLLPVLQQRYLAPCVPLRQMVWGRGRLTMEAGDLPVAEEHHPNLPLRYCLLNSNLWISCNKWVEILLVWNETLHLKLPLMHSLASPVVFMHMVPASLMKSRHQQRKRDASGQTADEGEKEPLGSLLLLPMEGGRAMQKIQIQVTV